MNPAPLHPVIIVVFDRDVRTQHEECITVVKPIGGELEFEFDLRVEQEAERMARRYGSSAFIYNCGSVATIPITIEEVD